MYARYNQIPYPTHKSPMDGDTAHRDLDWIAAARTDRVFALAPSPRGPVPRAAKLRLLQTAFWPALARWVEARQEVLPGGTLVGGWWRADMLGMLDWYRDCLGLVPRWDDAVAAHRDGVWRDALLSSPWFHWPEFFHLLKEPVRDAEGRLVTEEATGGVLYRDRDPRGEGMEDAFMDVWEAVANKRPLKKTARGEFILPHMLPPRGEWKRIQQQRRKLMAQEAAEIGPCASC
ncbi:hypothetical protein ISF_00622 [Cordyceps fumosorosea ARSEF 2679]|uniref:Uncharacterized protein n=1 Tax=Cordyceps fumosorosea (strain ARSEF 2679) TaxID=1081104 RepID=A0A168EEK5_CORFA|nr:hypothetical protein ISF_00622 [Cordyceps fumosorosea ARSEF 2679]OAA73721.1 hypothetical protein ISF_00622 [Cordyceps fumosorosea ARSEF 2679]